jgi:hypothetical protein
MAFNMADIFCTDLPRRTGCLSPIVFETVGLARLFGGNRKEALAEVPVPGEHRYELAAACVAPAQEIFAI